MIYWYELHVTIIQQTFVNLLLALSVAIPLRLGVFSVAGVGSFAIGAYTVAIMNLRYGVSNPFLLLCIGILIAGVAGFLLGLVVQRLDGLTMGLATLAYDLILTVVVTNGGSVTGGATGLFGVLVGIPMYAVVILVVVVLGIIFWTERGRLGRQIMAVHDDPSLATAMGVSVWHMRRMGFVASGVLGAAAGGISVLFSSTVAPASVGFDLAVLALTIIIIGGAGSWLGAVIGSLLVTWLPSFLSFISTWQTLIYSAIVVIMAVLAPGGIMGTVTNRSRLLAAKRRQRVASAPRAESTTLADRQVAAEHDGIVP